MSYRADEYPDYQEPKPDGISLIAAERERQIREEGWTPENDDEHEAAELAEAAACYAHGVYIGTITGRNETSHLKPPSDWPWDRGWWKPKDPIRDLVRAGALIAAEIDRRIRSGEHSVSLQRKGALKP